MKNSKLVALISIIVFATSSLVFSSCSSGLQIPDEYNYDDFSVYITLGEYKGLSYEKVVPEVTDDDVDEYINTKLSDSKETKEIKEGIVKVDSVVNIDYVGYTDGKKFDGGSAEGIDLDIANSGYIDGFAEGIVGHKVGETFDLNVTFPEDYGATDLAGKPAVFKTTINYIKQEIIPELNDSFVQSISDYKTVDEYKDYVYDLLMEDKKTEAASKEQASLFNQIVDSSKIVKYPEIEYNNRLTTITNNYNDGSSDFSSMAESQAKETVKIELVLHAIAKAEGIEITKSVYNDYVNKLLEDAGVTQEQFEQNSGTTLAQYALDNSLYTSCLYQNVLNKVMEYSSAK